MKGYYAHQYFTYPLRDRAVKEKIRYLCDAPRAEMVEERDFILLVTKLIEEAYDSAPSKLGI